MRAQVVMSKFAARIVIPEKFRIIEARAELLCDSVGFIRHIVELLLHQSLGRFLHGCKCSLARFLICVLIQKYLCLKDLSLGSRQTKLRVRYDLTGTLTDTHIANCELAAVTPIGIKSWILVVRWNARQIIQHAFDLDFSDPLHEGFE